MAQPPVTRRASWSSAAADPGATLLRAAAGLAGRGGTVEPTGFTADFGSALGYRLLDAQLDAQRDLPATSEEAAMFDDRWREILTALLAALAPRAGADVVIG